MIKLNKFYYPTSFVRSDTDGQGRTYDVKDQVALASVTTILGETKDKSFLESVWYFFLYNTLEVLIHISRFNGAKSYKYIN